MKPSLIGEETKGKGNPYTAKREHSKTENTLRSAKEEVRGAEEKLRGAEKNLRGAEENCVVQKRVASGK